MSLKAYDEQDIQNIADAIRSKSETTQQYKVSEMADAISQITTKEDLSEELNTQDTLIENQEVSIEDIKKALVGKGSQAIKIQEKDVEITENGETIIEPDEDFDVLSKVNVNVNIPSPFASKFLLETSDYTTSRIPFLLLEVPVFEIPSTVKDVSYLFAGLSNLENIDLTKYDFSNVENMSYLLYNCARLKEIDLSNINMSKVTSLSSAFSMCRLCETIKLSNNPMPDLKSINYTFSNCFSLKKIEFGSMVNSPITSLDHTFYYSDKLEELDFSNFDLSKVTSFNNTFAHCSGLKNVKFPTEMGMITNLYYTFTSCNVLEEIDLKNFNLSKMTDMSNCFENCWNLKKIDLSFLNNTVLRKTGYLFRRCYQLQEIYLDNLNLTQITTFSYMFTDCGSKLPTGQLTKVYVKDEASQNWVLTANNGHPTNWTTDNVIIAGSEADTREA